MCSGNDCAFFLIPIFPMFFIGLAMLLSMLLAKFGGWDELVEKYKLVDHMPQGEHFRMSSAVVQKRIPINYNSSLNITVTPEGIGMSTIWFFKLHHKPFFIPWGDLEYHEGKVIAGTSAVLEVRGMGITITFWGKKLVTAVKEHK